MELAELEPQHRGDRREQHRKEQERELPIAPPDPPRQPGTDQDEPERLEHEPAGANGEEVVGEEQGKAREEEERRRVFVRILQPRPEIQDVTRGEQLRRISAERRVEALVVEVRRLPAGEIRTEDVRREAGVACNLGIRYRRAPDAVRLGHERREPADLDEGQQRAECPQHGDERTTLARPGDGLRNPPPDQPCSPCREQEGRAACEGTEPRQHGDDDREAEQDAEEPDHRVLDTAGSEIPGHASLHNGALQSAPSPVRAGRVPLRRSPGSETGRAIFPRA